MYASHARGLGHPRRAIGIAVGPHRFGLHLAAVARPAGRHVATPDDLRRIDEMLMEVVDVLADAVAQGAAYRDVVEDRQVLHVLTEPDATGVRAHRNSELGREQQHRQHLVDAAQPAAVDLAEIDRAGLQQLLEDHAVLHVLTGGDASGLDGRANALVTKDVVRTGRLLYPPWIDIGQAAHRRDGFVDSPDLIGVQHQVGLGPDGLSEEPGAAQVRFRGGADLQLDVREAGGDGLARQVTDALVAVTEPA